jgi:hypothetical protein
MSAGLAPGSPLSAYLLIRLPYGAPAGTYRLLLRIYDETFFLSGLTPPPDGDMSGRDLLIGSWQATPTSWTAVERETDLPERIDIPVNDDLTLAAHNAGSLEWLQNGSELRLSLLWRGNGALPPVTLADSEGRWSVEARAPEREHGDIALDWRSIRVPADAPMGTADLKIGGWLTLATYRVESMPMMVDPPPFDRVVGAELPGVGELVGYTLSEAPFSRDDPPRLTLIWRAAGASELDYTVFAQLIDGAGRVIAQSDSRPMNQARPTTGWRAGEYIEDAHSLRFNELEGGLTGTARLIVGLYDAATGQRLTLADGSDAVTLAEGLAVER